MYNLVAAPLPPPTYIDWSVDTVGNVTFKWTPVTSECFTSSYSILTSNCGSCPTTTAHTAVTCASLPSDGSLCTFAIQTVVCGNITGNTSDPVHITIMHWVNHHFVLLAITQCWLLPCTGSNHHITVMATVIPIGSTVLIIATICIIFTATVFLLRRKAKIQGDQETHKSNINTYYESHLPQRLESSTVYSASDNEKYQSLELFHSPLPETDTLEKSHYNHLCRPHII